MCFSLGQVWQSILTSCFLKKLYLEEQHIENIAEKEEVKEPHYYSKDNPENLMTDEMLKRVPELYAQEEIDLADKEVHAAYIIPFKVIGLGI